MMSRDVLEWSKSLRNGSIKITQSKNLSPHPTSLFVSYPNNANLRSKSFNSFENRKQNKNKASDDSNL